MSDPTADRDPFEIVAESFLERFRAGERPGVEEYAARHPDLADQIRELLPALVMVEQDLVIDRDTGLSGARRSTSETPRHLGDYRILREIGRGGMGVVYEAEQVSLGRRVALKVLPGHGMGDRKTRERFRREAKSAARLHHTNIVPIFEVGRDDEVSFYAMQLIQGQGLDQVIDELARLRDPSKIEPRQAEKLGPRETVDQTPDDSATGPRRRELGLMAGSLLIGSLAIEGLDPSSSSGTTVTERFEPGTAAPGSRAGATGDHPAPVPSADLSGSAVLPGGKHVSEVDTSGRRQPFFRSVAQIGRQAAQGLAHAHARGIVHRDIKPSNLLLDVAGVVWITDFGLAKADDDGMTATGDILGTLRYMAPERFRGEGDARADIYALGLTLYELLTLRPAYNSTDRLKLIEQIKNVEPVRPRSIDGRIPRDLETIVLKSIDKDSERRYATAESFSEDLRRFLADEPIRAREISTSERYWRWARRNPAIATLGAVLTTVLVLVTFLSLLAATRFSNLAELQGNSVIAERSARTEAQTEAHRALLSESKAVSERKRADTMLADMFTSRGLIAGERDAPAEAALWFAAAANQSAIAEDSRRREDNRLRARNWMQKAILPVAAIWVPGKSIPPEQLEFQPGGDLLLVRFAGAEIILWSWRADRRLAWAEKLVGVRLARFSPDGASIALGFLNGEVQIRNVADGELLAQIQQKEPSSALAYSPDGRFLAIAAKSVRLWDINDQALLRPVWNHPRPVDAVMFNHRGDRLITACADKLARVFAVKSGQEERVEPLYAPAAHILKTRPALIDHDRVLVTVSGGSELSRWDMATGERLANPIKSSSTNLQGVVASSDGNWFATGGYYGPELYKADTDQPQARMGHTNFVKKFAFSPDDTILLSVSMDSTARLWSIADGQPLGPPLRHMANAEGCAWTDDSRYLATAQTDGLIRVWERPANDPVVARVDGWGRRPLLSNDGRLVVPGIWHETATGGRNLGVNRLRVLSSANGQPTGEDIKAPGVLVDSCVCSDNLAVATVSSSGTTGLLGVWDLPTASPRFEPIVLPGLPLSIASRPGSNQLAVLCSRGELLVIDDRTGKRVLDLRHDPWHEPGAANQVQYSPDGKILASLITGPGSTVNVRDADSGRLRFTPLSTTMAGSNFHSFSISWDSRFLATMALVKNAVQVWNLETGRALATPLPHPGDYWGLFSVRFSPDGQHLLTGHKDGQARYWDWQAGKLACPPMSHDNEVHDVAITPDGRFALTTTTGKPELHVWELATGRRVAPPVRLMPSKLDWSDTLAITPDGLRALVVLSGSHLAVVNLEELLSASTTPIPDLELLAELATSQRIELGDLSGLTTDQWQERWKLLQRRNPNLKIRPEIISLIDASEGGKGYGTP